MRKVVVLEEAVLDLEKARAFYDAQDQGIGDYCVTSLLSDLERLGLYHGIHARHFGLNRILAGRFPFGIYYRDTEAETQVVAILDLRRNPSWIRRELGKRK
jgi:hypothetical protein